MTVNAVPIENVTYAEAVNFFCEMKMNELERLPQAEQEGAAISSTDDGNDNTLSQITQLVPC